MTAGWRRDGGIDMGRLVASLPGWLLMLACAIALPARAQDTAEDWDVVRDPAKKSVLAFTTYDSGISIAFRCIDRSLNAVLAGLPPSRETRRRLRLQFRDGEPYESMWTSTRNNSVVVGDYPAPLARDFRQGGRLQIDIAGGAADGRNLRHIVELPTSNAAIDEVLTRCERPLVDPRDAELEATGDTGLPCGLDWRRPPRPEFPSDRYAWGFVVTTCITNPDGTLRDCEIEMEHPQDGNFGDATLRAIRRARVRNAAEPDAPVPTVRVGFHVQYVMQ